MFFSMLILGHVWLHTVHNFGLLDDFVELY